MTSEAWAIRSVLLGLVANTLLCVVKILSGIIGNSYALIADGIESALDIFSSLIVWGGLVLAASPPDEDHPYGHGKVESLAAIVVSLLLICGAIAIAVESIREIVTPHHAPAPFTLAVLVGVVLIKALLSRTVLRAAQQTNSTAVQADAWHHLSDALTSVAAFIGISIALIGGDGYESADDYAALFAAGIIFYNGASICWRGIKEVLDTVASGEIEQQVRTAALGVAGVRAIDECRVRKSGLKYLVDIHVVVDGNLSVRAGHEIARAVRRTLSSSALKVRDALVHIEPWEKNMSPRLDPKK